MHKHIWWAHLRDNQQESNGTAGFCILVHKCLWKLKNLSNMLHTSLWPIFDHTLRLWTDCPTCWGDPRKQSPTHLAQTSWCWRCNLMGGKRFIILFFCFILFCFFSSFIKFFFSFFIAAWDCTYFALRNFSARQKTYRRPSPLRKLKMWEFTNQSWRSKN